MINRIRAVFARHTLLKWGVAGGVLVAIVLLFCGNGGLQQGGLYQWPNIHGALPLPGQLVLAKNIAPGQAVRARQSLGNVVTTQANDQIPGTVAQRSALEIQLAELDKQISGIDQRLQVYQQQRQQYLAERMQQQLGEKQSAATFVQLKEELSAITAQTAFSRQQLQRYENLYQQRFISRMEYEERKNNTRVLQASRGESSRAPSAFTGRECRQIRSSADRAKNAGCATAESARYVAHNREYAAGEATADCPQAGDDAKHSGSRCAPSLPSAGGAQQQHGRRDLGRDGGEWCERPERHPDCAHSGLPHPLGRGVLMRLTPAVCARDGGNGASDHRIRHALERNDKNPPRREWTRGGRGEGRTAPPEIARRQLPVKVLTAHIDIDWKDVPDPASFCLAGRSVTVNI